MRKALLVFGAVAALLLGWGYWHASSYAALSIAVYDISLKSDRQAYGPVLGADLALTDAGGAILAKGRADQPSGTVSIDHPEVGDCRREEREASLNSRTADAWQQCFETQSRWFMTWVRAARYATVNLGNCTLDRVPVLLEEYKDDWWLWWAPLPHVGGRPYTYFKLTLWIDSRNCRIASRKSTI